MDLRRNPLAHRTTLTVRDPEKALQAVRRISAQWLTGKYGSAPHSSGLHRLGRHVVLTNQAAYRHDGSEYAIRLQLREDNPEATWRTTITAVDLDRVSALISVALEFFPNGDGPLVPRRPRLVRDLVRDLEPVDGPARLTLEAIGVHAADVDPLIELLCDPERRMPLIVLARPDRPNPVWNKRTNEAMPKCAGAASLYMLEDRDAVDAFRKAIGEHHRVASGSIRMYLPKVDPAWPPDSPRHRFLTMARMVDPSDHVWNGLASTVERLSTEAPVPQALRDLSFPDIGTRGRQERQDALATDRTSDRLAILQKNVTELEELLTEADEELKESARTADLSARTIASLEERLHAAGERADEDTEEVLRALDDVERARAEADLLRSRLRIAGRYDETVVAEQPRGVPDSFEGLWKRLPDLDSILVTADKTTALGLDEADRARVWAAKAWNGLRALNSYARAAREGFNGGFYQYCNSDRPGTVNWPRKQIAMVESSRTMHTWGSERIFQVPAEVSSSGHMEMQAHLKLDSKGSTSPRIYFMDDTKGPTGKVIVGYVGPHLTNTKTT